MDNATIDTLAERASRGLPLFGEPDAGPGHAPEPHRPAPRPQPPAGVPTSGCGKDVYTILAEAGVRLTLSQVMAEVIRQGLEWDERTVRRHLTRFKEMRLADNDRDARPPGYGLLPGGAALPLPSHSSRRGPDDRERTDPVTDLVPLLQEITGSMTWALQLAGLVCHLRGAPGVVRLVVKDGATGGRHVINLPARDLPGAGRAPRP
jgi:hypothetical protein